MLRFRNAVMSAVVSAAVVAGAIAGGGVLGAATATQAAATSSSPASDPASDPSAGAGVSATASTQSTVKTRMYRYGKANRHELRVQTPSTSGRRLPTVVLVHGGAWVKGSMESMVRPEQAFNDRGYITVNIHYRFAQRAGWPAQRDDLQRAIEWVEDRADKLRVDTDRIVVLGSSAGAEIAASALTEGRGSRYGRGYVALSGPMDLALTARTSRDKLEPIIVDSLLGCTVGECPKRYRKASAIDQVSRNDTPSLLIAAKDEWVDSRSSVRLHDAARKAGLDSKLVMLPGILHGMDNWDAAWPSIRSWVDKRMAAKR